MDRTDDYWRSGSRALLERLTQDHPPEFFQALYDLIGQRFPRGRRRRKGDDAVDDSSRLSRLAELLRTGVSEGDAIRQVAHEDPGDDERNTRKRLTRKLPRARVALQRPSEAEKEAILWRAFEAPVEQWRL